MNKLGDNARMISHLWYGTAEPNGDNLRLLHRFGVDTRIVWPSVALAGHVKVNDFGPYDYHHDFNMTFPLQVMADLSYTLGRPKWFGLPQTRIGVRGTYRTLDRYSNRYQPAGATAPLIQGELYPGGPARGPRVGDPHVPAPGHLGRGAVRDAKTARSPDRAVSLAAVPRGATRSGRTPARSPRAWSGGRPWSSRARPPSCRPRRRSAG